ncbi:MAG TPA: YidC/Oxa1 family membrane protein insertase [Candidatus Paceibacterota bacterium]
MSWLYNAFVYKPLYNGLIFLLNALPLYANAALAIILFTLIVKFILLPLSKAAIRTQIKMKELEPLMKAVKEKYKNDKNQQSLEIMKLYRENKLNPLSGFFLILIQIPIIIALYRIFLYGGLPEIHTELLYPFVHAPEPGSVSMHLFGFDILQKSPVFAIIAAASQYFQAKFSMPLPASQEKKEGFQHDLGKMMSVQMKFVFPIIVLMISLNLAAAVVLYWITSNLFAVGQEILVRRRMLEEHENSKKLKSP